MCAISIVHLADCYLGNSTQKSDNGEALIAAERSRMRSNVTNKEYTLCLHCRSEQIFPDLALQDAGAYPSGSHKVAVETGATARIFGKKGGSTILRAYVCADCGFTALFAQEPDQLSTD